MAFVVTRSGDPSAADEIVAWSREQMANYKVPRAVEVVDELPINATGKVVKDELRAQGRLDERRRMVGFESLADLRVVELGVWVAAPATAALLADWGADVIKVEPPDRRPDARRVRLARHRRRHAEPGVRARQPGQAERRARPPRPRRPPAPRGPPRPPPTCSSRTSDPTRSTGSTSRPAATVARHPRLVYCSVSGYGLRGDERDRPTYDIGAFWSRSGLAGQMADGDGVPLNARGGIGDHVTGLAALAGVLAAVMEQRHTGRGRVVEISLLRTGAYVLGWDLGIQMTLGKVAGAEPRHRNQAPLMNPYLTADGRWFFFTGLEAARHLPSVCRALDRPDLLDDARFADASSIRRNRTEVIAMLDEIVAQRTLDEWAERFDREGVLWAPVQSPAEVVADPQLLDNEGFVEIPTGDGGPRVRSVNGPITFSDLPLERDRSACRARPAHRRGAGRAREANRLRSIADVPATVGGRSTPSRVAQRRETRSTARWTNCNSISVTAAASVIMRSWPVSISQTRSASSCRASASGSDVRSDSVQFTLVARDAPHRGLVAQVQRLLEATPRVRCEPVLHPRQIVRVRHSEEPAHLREGPQHELDAVDRSRPLPGEPHRFARDVDQRLPVGRVRRVEVDELGDPFVGAVGDPGDHHAAVAVTDEDHVDQVAVTNEVDHLVDVGVEVDAGVDEVGALADAQQRRRVDLVAGVAERPDHPVPAPRAVSASMNEDVGRHLAASRRSALGASPGQQAAGDDQPLDLVRALADHHERRVAVVALDRKIGGVADAAVDAHGLGGQLERGLAGEQLGHARLDVAAQTGRLALGRVAREQAGRLQLRRHVGELELDRLVLGDGLAERDPLLGVLERGVEGGTCHPDGPRRDVDASDLEDARGSAADPDRPRPRGWRPGSDGRRTPSPPSRHRGTRACRRGC